MKIKFEFSFPEESNTAVEMLNASNYSYILNEMYQLLQSIITVNPQGYSDDQLIVARNIYDELHHYFQDVGFSAYDNGGDYDV